MSSPPVPGWCAYCLMPLSLAPSRVCVGVRCRTRYLYGREVSDAEVEEWRDDTDRERGTFPPSVPRAGPEVLFAPPDRAKACRRYLSPLLWQPEQMSSKRRWAAAVDSDAVPDPDDDDESPIVRRTPSPAPPAAPIPPRSVPAQASPPSRSGATNMAFATATPRLVQRSTPARPVSSWVREPPSPTLSTAQSSSGSQPLFVLSCGALPSPRIPARLKERGGGTRAALDTSSKPSAAADNRSPHSVPPAPQQRSQPESRANPPANSFASSTASVGAKMPVHLWLSEHDVELEEEFVDEGAQPPPTRSPEEALVHAAADSAASSSSPAAASAPLVPEEQELLPASDANAPAEPAASSSSTLPGANAPAEPAASSPSTMPDSLSDAHQLSTPAAAAVSATELIEDFVAAASNSTTLSLVASDPGASASSEIAPAAANPAGLPPVPKLLPSPSQRPLSSKSASLLQNPPGTSVSGRPARSPSSANNGATTTPPEPDKQLICSVLECPRERHSRARDQRVLLSRAYANSSDYWRARRFNSLNDLVAAMTKHQVFVCDGHFVGHALESAHARALVTGVVDAVARLRDIDAILSSQNLRRRTVTGAGTCLINLLAVALHRAGILLPAADRSEVFADGDLSVRQALLGSLIDVAVQLVSAVTLADLEAKPLVTAVYSLDTWLVMRGALLADGAHESPLVLMLSYLDDRRPAGAPLLDSERIGQCSRAEELSALLVEYFAAALTTMRLERDSPSPQQSLTAYFAGLAKALQGCAGAATKATSGFKPSSRASSSLDPPSGFAWSSSFYDVLMPVFRPVLVGRMAVLAWRDADSSAMSGGLGEAEFAGVAGALLSPADIAALVRRHQTTLLQIGHPDSEHKGLPSLHFELVEDAGA